MTSRLKRGIGFLAAAVAISACSSDAINEPQATSASSAAATTGVVSHDVVSQVYTSGSDVMTWNPIPEPYQGSDWPAKMCTQTPRIGLNADWQNPHNAYVLYGHPWANNYFVAPWINAWPYLDSFGGNPVAPSYNWTKYSTQVSGNGSFVIHLLADNCSWIYLDNTLVGVQTTNLDQNQYGLTLDGTHTLTFIIFDGGGAAGGKFRLETTTNPPPALNPDLDDDGHLNESDAFPLDPKEWVDTDGDGVGDNSDAFATNAAESKDTDGDGVGDNTDAFPTNAAESLDTDHDTVGDNGDNCPAIANTDQADLDHDGAGDACDSDIDGDGVTNDKDAFPTDPSRFSLDIDNDGVVDASDNCPAIANASQADLDHDGMGDACDTDIDGDGVSNGSDAFPTNPAESLDSDHDGVGNNADPYDNSNTGPSLVVGACVPGVANWRVSGGVWANDLIANAFTSASNHGAFVSNVADIATGWMNAGQITGKQHGQIVSCAARTK
jgi:hypothetical protein